jgi:hypothetical protein
MFNDHLPFSHTYIVIHYIDFLYTEHSIIIHPKGKFIADKPLERESWEKHKTWLEAGTTV